MNLTLQETLITTAVEYVVFVLLILKTLDEDVREYGKFMWFIFPIAVITAAMKTEIYSYVMTGFYLTSFAFLVKGIFNKNILISFLTILFSWSMVLFLQILSAGILVFTGFDTAFSFPFAIRILIISLTLSIPIYLFVPLYKIIEALKIRKELKHIIIAVSLALIVAAHYYRQSFRSSNLDSFAILAIYTLIILAGYYIVCLALETKDRNVAKKNYENFRSWAIDNGKIAPYVQQSYEKHLKAAYALAVIGNDNETIEHIKRYLSDMQLPENLQYTFPDMEPKNLDRKAFAVYLHVKMTQLKVCGYGLNCWLNIYDYSVAARINDSQLIKAVNILIDYACDSLDKSKIGNGVKGIGDVAVSITKQNDGRPAIEVLYRSDETIHLLTLDKKYNKAKGNNRGNELYKINKIMSDNNCNIELNNKKIDGEKYASFKLIL